MLHDSVLKFILEHGHFWNIDISPVSVATYLRCGVILKYNFVANLPISLPLQEFENLLTFLESRCSSMSLSLLVVSGRWLLKSPTYIAGCGREGSGLVSSQGSVDGL